MRKAALEAISQLIEADSRVVFVGSDLGVGTLADARRRFPKRVFVEGIAEQHIVGFASGLAMEGFVPYAHTIGTFLTRRALEQVIVDVALHRLPVRLVATGGGLVYAPLGPTHQATEDFALMRAIPNMQIYAPADPLEMTQTIKWLATSPGPAYVRIAKGGEPVITDDMTPTEPGPIRVARQGSDIAVLSTGPLLMEALEAAKDLSIQGISAHIIHVPCLSPLDSANLLIVLETFQRIVTVEEHIPIGGLWSAIVELSNEAGVLRKIDRISLPYAFAGKYGSQRDHWQSHDLVASGISRRVLQILEG